MNTTFKVRRQGSKSLGRLMVTQKVRHSFWMKRPTNLKLDTQLKHEEPQHAQCHDLQSQRSWWQGYVVLLTRIKKRIKCPRNSKIGSLVAHVTDNNAHQFQGKNVEGQDYQADYCLNRKCIICTERQGLWMNFKIGTPMEHTERYQATYNGL